MKFFLGEAIGLPFECNLSSIPFPQLLSRRVVPQVIISQFPHKHQTHPHLSHLILVFSPRVPIPTSKEYHPHELRLFSVSSQLTRSDQAHDPPRQITRELQASRKKLGSTDQAL